MSFFKKYSVPILVLLALGLALFLRIVIPYHLVFTNAGIRFVEADPYAHMRLVDNMLAHFPTRTPFDPYIYFPQGAPVYYPPLFTTFLSGFIWLFTFGAHTARAIDTAGALFPAILGSLTVIPVFFIAKTLFNKWAGTLAAILMAVMPGEVLGRTMLGFTDHHVVEILFTATALMFFIMAVKSAKERELVMKPFEWAKARKPLLFAALSALFFGLYLQMWNGGPIFILILLVFFVAQFIIDHLKGNRSDYLLITGTATMAITSIVVLPFLPQFFSRPLYFIALTGATLLPIVLYFMSSVINKWGWPKYTFPISLLALCATGLLILRTADAGLFNTLASNFNILHPSNLDETIGEVAPLFSPDGSFSFSVAWLNFTTGFYFALATSVIFIYQVIKKNEPQKTVLVIWSVSTLLLTLAQRRFAYYYAVNVALLTACLAWMFLSWSGIKESMGQQVDNLRKKIKEKTPREAARANVFRVLAVGAVILFAIAPNIPPAIQTVDQAPFAPDSAWLETMNWMKNNTPDPFPGNNMYYQVVPMTQNGANYDYPSSAYGVLTWWDYGNWVERIAQRIPNNAPSSGRSPVVAKCLLAQDEATAQTYTKQLESLYLITDYATEVFKFYAVCDWAGTKREDYFDSYYQNQNGQLQQVFLFYPQYFQTLLVRLYSFNGQAVTPTTSTVITYAVKQNGATTYKEITDVHKFTNYADAQAYVTAHPQNTKIVSTSPFDSPVPLTALQHYKLVYTSPDSSSPVATTTPTPVKTFMYLDDLRSLTASTAPSGNNQ